VSKKYVDFLFEKRPSFLRGFKTIDWDCSVILSTLYDSVCCF